MSQMLPRKMLIGTALGCILVGVLVAVGLRLARPKIVSTVIEHRMRGIDYAACNAAPAAWGFVSGEVSLFAYDRTGRSLNPAAPKIEDHLLRKALAEEEMALQIASNQMLFVIPRQTEGPCAVIRGTTNNASTAVSPRIWSVLLGAMLFGVLFAVFAVFLLVVRPLRSRIEEASMAAQSVGSDSFTPCPKNSDALGQIAEVLATSHKRIVDAQKALESRNQALEYHLAGVAHDLRTPLSSMHLALEALAAESGGPLQQEARRALADVVFLSSMVENLHQAARLRHTLDVTSGTVELVELVHRLEKRFSIVGRHAGVEVAANTPEGEVWVGCAPALAERAVANLVQNGVEHNKEAGHVAIRLSLLDSESRFQLVITDDGPGLPDDTLASLQNESFLMNEARPRGPGMGMLITKEVAHRAGWSIQYAVLEPTGLEVRIEGPTIAP